jgi:glycosyltransferase involved in cell wall biosynthesis
MAGRPNIRWLGHVPYARVGELFEGAHVLLHTGNGQQEGFPNVFLQAWAAGLPVVSTGVDPDGLLSGGGLGLCVDSAEQAAAAVARLKADAGLRQAIGVRAREHVMATHHLEVVMPQYAALFSALGRDGQ